MDGDDARRDLSARQILLRHDDVLAVMAEACDRSPNRPAIVFEDGASITRHSFKEAVERFAGFLAGRVGPGDRIAIMLENRIEFMIAWMAVIANNAILVSINPTSGKHDAGHILRDSGAALAIGGEGQRELLEELGSECDDLRGVVIVGSEEPGGLDTYGAAGKSLDLRALRIDPEAITNIYYTSGTTGPPKGCMLGHDYWLRYAELYFSLYGLSPDDRLLCCLPFFYGDPPWQMLLSLGADTTLVAMRRFSVSRFWDVVRRHAVTRLFSVASIPSLLLKAPPSERDRDHAITHALHAGIPAALHQKFVDRWGFPWAELYGLTETGLVVSMPTEHVWEMTGSGSIGVPAPGVDIRICSEGGSEAAAGELGELTVRAPGMMRGYWNQPEETDATVRDGWLRTGDIGRLDERGFLYFVGRSKDIIRRSGENVAAGEVEALLRAHPDISDAAVVAVPDDLRGEEVKAYVELKQGVTTVDLPPLRIVEYCAQHLAKHKVPRYVDYQTEPFPRTPSMRVKKTELLAAVAGAWDREAGGQV